MSDISPIARAIGEDASQYQESRYTNILDSNARSVLDSRVGDSDKPSERRRVNPYKQKQGILDFIGSPAASLDDPSFLISDRSINIPDIKQVADILAKSHKPREQPLPAQPAEQPDPGVIQEQRIRQLESYQSKVLSAISDSAKKKIKEQKEALSSIQSEQLESNKSLLQSAQQRRAAELASGITPKAGQQEAHLDREYDKDFVDYELQMIISKNRQKMAENPEPSGDPSALDRSELDQDGYF